MGPGGEAQLWMLDRSRLVPSSSSLQMLADLAVVMSALVRAVAAGEARRLHARGRRPPARASRRSTCPAAAAPKLLERHGRHFDVDVDAVQQRAADLGHVPLDLRQRAVALAARVAAIAAGARVQRGDQHEIGRKRRAELSARQIVTCRLPAAGAALRACGG